MRLYLKDAAGYLAASGCALIADLGLLWLLANFFGWGYLAAATLSFLAGGIVAYMISVTFVFKQRRVQDRRLEFIGFLTIGIIGLMVNTAVIFAAITYLGMHYLVAKVMAAFCTFTCNFVVRRQVLFVQSPSYLRDECYGTDRGP